MAALPDGPPESEARSIAVRAGLSPTTATRALARLLVAGLVEVKVVPFLSGAERRIMAVRVLPAEIYAAVRDTRLPPVRVGRGPLPKDLHAHLFGLDVTALDLESQASDIARRLLGTQDERAGAWTLANLPLHICWGAVAKRDGREKARQYVGARVQARQ